MGYFALVREELQLLKFDGRWKLYNDLLRELTELRGLPSTGVRGRVQELSDGVFRFFSTAVDNTILQLYDGLRLPA